MRLRIKAEYNLLDTKNIRNLIKRTALTIHTMQFHSGGRNIMFALNYSFLIFARKNSYEKRFKLLSSVSFSTDKSVEESEKSKNNC